ncbi:MAG: hypothetical protein K2O42_06435, partial [Oscillospiraceae bacterium]|nr:hypothetical protein [Oscillospiraceae bacterium]
MRRFYLKIMTLFLCLCVGIFLTGCDEILFDFDVEMIEESGQTDSAITPETQPEISMTETGIIIQTESESESELESESTTETPETKDSSQNLQNSQDFEIPEDETPPESVEKDGSYTSPEDVAEYIHTFGTLPGNFITKKEA